MMRKQKPWAIMLAIVAVLLLAFPSALAVYEWLKPIRGEEAARSAAAGIELTYLALACLIFLTKELQSIARRLQLWAVFTAVLLNSIDSYAKRGVDLSSGAQAWLTFDPWLLILSIAESIPLAGLAFGVSMILHRLIADDIRQAIELESVPELSWSEKLVVYKDWLQVWWSHRRRFKGLQMVESSDRTDSEISSLWDLPMPLSDTPHGSVLSILPPEETPEPSSREFEFFDLISDLPQHEGISIVPLNAEWRDPEDPRERPSEPIVLAGLDEVIKAYRLATDEKDRRRLRRVLREKHNYRLSQTQADEQEASEP